MAPPSVFCTSRDAADTRAGPLQQICGRGEGVEGVGVTGAFK